MTLPAGFVLVAPGQWLAGGTTLILLKVLPAGTTALEALQGAVELSQLTFDPNQVIDGADVAGRPAKVYRGQVELDGNPFDFDFIAFANAAGAYVVQAYQGNAAVLDAYRQGTLPALLETVTVTE